MEKELIEILKNSKKPLSFNYLYNKLLKYGNENKLKKILHKYENDFTIVKNNKNSYVLLEKTPYRKGVFYSKDSNCGIVFTNNKVYNIYNKDINGAIDGDLVLINTNCNNKDKINPACIKRIIKREINNIVGLVYKENSNYYLKSYDGKNKKIKFRLNDFHTEGINVEASLIQKIGENEYLVKVEKELNNIYDLNEDILVETYKHGFCDKFNNDVLEEVNLIPNEISDSDKIGRIDLTNMEIFTIDGEDTKDIDDALSCKRLENGNYLLGVHIADVSNYVHSNSSIDKEACERGTSVYLANKVIPMLPEKLSNGICSLFPGVLRLAVSCFMEITPQGNVVNHDFFKSIIKSNKQMTYEEVNKILNGKNYDASYRKHIDTLKMLNDLSISLKNKRINQGAIDFSKNELKLIYDNFDNIIRLRKYKSGLAEDLIEELMIIANETVDKHLTNHGFMMLHRVHDKPIAEKLEDFYNILNSVGYKFEKHNYLECSNNREFFLELEKHIKKTGRLKNMLTNKLIRCMSKAEYSTNNIGHYGLAKNNYCHFTSPIRRYPDLVTHRLVKLDMENLEQNSSYLTEIGYLSSKKERNAQKLENEVMKIKIAQYMEKHIGEVYTGIITDVYNDGLKVQLDNLVEGVVNINDIPGKYLYKAKDYCLVSLNNYDNYKIGDSLELKLKEVSRTRKNINFTILKKFNDKKTKIKKI